MTGHGTIFKRPECRREIKFASCSSWTIFYNNNFEFLNPLYSCMLNLEFERKSGGNMLRKILVFYSAHSLPDYLWFVRIYNILDQKNDYAQTSRSFEYSKFEYHTLIMITRVDLNRVGFASGSNTVEDDWNDWNKPVMSRERAKLFRKRTCETMCEYDSVRLVPPLPN